jgi:hypothetical protein
MAGEKYLGNRDNKEVHDLERETPECLIDKIMRADNEIAFRTIDDAHDQGYKDCPYCMDEDARNSCKV